MTRKPSDADRAATPSGAARGAPSGDHARPPSIRSPAILPQLILPPAATAPSILIVSPPSVIANEARAALLEAGFGVATARDGDEAVRRLARDPASVALLSLVLPTEDSLQVLVALRRAAPGLRVLVVVNRGTLGRAADAMRLGAFDYLAVPVDRPAVIEMVRNALPPAGGPPVPRPEAEAVDLSAPPPGLIGRSPAMRPVFAALRRLAPARAPVLIASERGAGRCSLAQALHALSPRAAGPFRSIDCKDRDDDLLEAAIFGPPDGAAGGLVEAARGGSLFLDGISATGPALQTRILRLLQTGAPRPSGLSGDAPPRRADVRLICATSRDLQARVREGRFREELWYRLAVARIDLPPLRERREDIRALADCALTRAATRAGRRFTAFHPEVLRAFEEHPWPGNVGELFETVGAAVADHDGALLIPAMLPPEFFAVLAKARRAAAGHLAQPPLGPRAAPPATAASGGATAPGAAVALTSDPGAPLAVRLAPLVGLSLAAVEAALIEATLAQCGGSAVKAARLLGVSPSTLYRRLGRAEGAGDGAG